MKLAFSTLGCPGWNFSEIVATARDLGYDGIEVRGIGPEVHVPSVPEFALETLDKTKERLGSLSIACLSSDCCLHDPGEKAKVKERALAYIGLAQKLGVPYVRVMGDAAVPQPTLPVDEGFVADFASELASAGERAGVTLLIETNGWLVNSEKLARLLEKINGACKALWDIHHPYRYAGEPPEVTLQNLKPFLRHVHIKDSVMSGGVPKYMMPGFGDLPIERFIGELKTAGFDGYYTLEWVKRWDLSLEEPGIVFAHYVNFMRTM